LSESIIIIITLIIILCDRALYIKQNSKYLQSEEVAKDIEEDIKSFNKSLDAQTEEKTVSIFSNVLLLKLILYYFVIFGYIVLIYFWYPYSVSDIICIEENEDLFCNFANKNYYIMFLNFLFFIYLYYSGKQIKFGYSGFGNFEK